MKPRGTALILALLLTAAAPMGRNACCSPNNPAEPQVTGLDCCADALECAGALECPARLQAVISAEVPGTISAPTTTAAPADTAGLVDPMRRVRLAGVSERSLRTSSGPPLYRLHAQLLI